MTTAVAEHPGGHIKHGRWMQFLRGASLAVYFLLSCVTIVVTQLIGSPLYFYDKDFFYAYMALTKQSFALLCVSLTEWWGPTTIRISGDASVAGQIRRSKDGRVQFDFPERIILIANHQIYTDWIYLWWAAYANAPQMHGHVFIILKESLKYLPILGLGMLFYGFIFMSRKMAVDQPRLAHRLGKLRERHVDPSGKEFMNPMWLLLFPEGTNLSGNSRRMSAKWAEKNNLEDPKHVLLPRSTGTYFCLEQLKGTVDYVYDCTVAYEGIPRGHFGDQYFTLSSTYFQGRAPKSVNFYWRRFRVSDIPTDTPEAFDLWLRERWYEKDALMEEYLTTGRFPPLESDEAKKGYIETAVRSSFPLEFTKIFVVPASVWLLVRLASNTWSRLSSIMG